MKIIFFEKRNIEFVKLSDFEQAKQVVFVK